MADEPTTRWMIWPDGEEPSDGYEFPATMFAHAADAVETTADRYHGDGGGEWQHGARAFRVRAPNGDETVWSVEIDYSPNFSAWEKK